MPPNRLGDRPRRHRSFVLHDTARTANGMLPPENWTYEHEVPRYHFNPAEARHLLQAVGYSPRDSRLGFVYKTIPEGAR